MTMQFANSQNVSKSRRAGILAIMAAVGFAPSVFAQYSSAKPPTATSVPAGFTACATDGKVCKVPAGATVTIYYGANSTYAVLSGKGDFTCLPEKLGITDPAMKVAKTCYIGGSGQTAAAPAPANIPAAAAGKVTSVPAGAVACATDGKTCAASGAWTGVYGVQSTFAPISGTGSFICLPATFKIPDPAPGVGKTCYIKGNIATAAAPAPSPAPVAGGCKSPTNANGSLAAPNPQNSNCQWTSAKTRRGSMCATSADCSCHCAANQGTACTFNNGKIVAVCKPGQHP